MQADSDAASATAELAALRVPDVQAIKRFMGVLEARHTPSRKASAPRQRNAMTLRNVAADTTAGLAWRDCGGAA
jgi:hypothetical protein